jgi:hypothetical protein
MDAVILRQSVQLQIKVSTRPGPWVGWGFGGGIRVEEIDELEEGRREPVGKSYVHKQAD